MKESDNTTSKLFMSIKIRLKIKEKWCFLRYTQAYSKSVPCLKQNMEKYLLQRKVINKFRIFTSQ